MLNLLTSEHVLKSLALVRKGKVYNLAVPLEERGPQFPEFHKTWRVTHYANDPSPEGFGIADDVVMMEAHSGTTSIPWPTSGATARCTTARTGGAR